MAGRKLEDQIERLRQFRNSAVDSDVTSQLQKALHDRSNLIVAEAAKTAAALHVAGLIPELLDAYDRLFANPLKSDPKCWGKTAIIQALAGLDYSESPPYLRGLRYVQMEPVWGGQEDAAGPLRGNCILALPQCEDLRRRELLSHLVDALSDNLDTVRSEAVRAIEQMNGDEAVLLLRLKARSGDSRPAVTGRVFDAILQLESAAGIAFVAEFLATSIPEVRDEAALALGSLRHPQAVAVLISAWHGSVDRAFRSTLLRAISSSREESALEFLLSLVREGASYHATEALAALELHRGSEEIELRVTAAKNVRMQDGKV